MTSTLALPWIWYGFLSKFISAFPPEQTLLLPYFCMCGGEVSVEVIWPSCFCIALYQYVDYCITSHSCFLNLPHLCSESEARFPHLLGLFLDLNFLLWLTGNKTSICFLSSGNLSCLWYVDGYISGMPCLSQQCDEFIPFYKSLLTFHWDFEKIVNLCTWFVL